MNLEIWDPTSLKAQVIVDALMPKEENIMILTVVRLKALTVKRKELQQTLHSLAAQMKTEKGCLDSNLYQLVEDENNFALIGTWENRKALDDHLQSNRFTVLMGARGLLSRSPEIMIHTVSQSSERRAGHLT